MGIIRVLFKFLFKCLLLIIAAAALLFVAGWIRGDDALDPSIEAFYQTDASDWLQDNGTIAIIGMAAPVDVKNTYDWAAKLVQSKDSEATWKAAASAVHIPDHIENVDCLLNTKWTSAQAQNPASCLSKQEANNLINANSLLLARYRDAMHYGRFVDIPSSGLYAEPMLWMQPLFCAYLVMRSEHAPEEALQDWIADAEFYRNAQTDQNSLITRSILMVNEALIQKTLPSLLEGHPELALKYLEPLQAALAPFGPSDMRMDLVVKAEYGLLSPVINRLGNYNRNKFYHFDQDWVAFWQTPFSRLGEANEELQKKYNHVFTISDWHAPYKSIMANLVIKGLLVGSDLIKAAYRQDAMGRMLNLYVQIKAKNIPPAQIATFIANSPLSLHDPFTGNPYHYDAASKTLSFELPGYGVRGLSL